MLPGVPGLRTCHSRTQDVLRLELGEPSGSLGRGPPPSSGSLLLGASGSFALLPTPSQGAASQRAVGVNGCLVAVPVWAPPALAGAGAGEAEGGLSPGLSCGPPRCQLQLGWHPHQELTFFSHTPLLSPGHLTTGVCVVSSSAGLLVTQGSEGCSRQSHDSSSLKCIRSLASLWT